MSTQDAKTKKRELLLQTHTLQAVNQTILNDAIESFIKSVPPQHREAARKHMANFPANVEKKSKELYSKYIDRLADMYELDEVEAFHTFTKSDAGSRFIAKMSNSMQVHQNLRTLMIQTIQSELHSMVQDFATLTLLEEQGIKPKTMA